jgi:arylsulfatase A-like enzyme
MRSYSNIPKQGQVSDSLAIDLIHGYYATVSYTDALIGKILKELEAQKLSENTLVILVSDHGYNLQEHTQWTKFTNYNTATQVPLIIYNPLSKSNGTTAALTSLIDIYPTLVEICELKAPKEQLDGTSLVPILKKSRTGGEKTCFYQKSQWLYIKNKGL